MGRARRIQQRHHPSNSWMKQRRTPASALYSAFESSKGIGCMLLKTGDIPVELSFSALAVERAQGEILRGIEIR